MLRVRISSGAPEQILDFDIETLAAGYADPSWVPDKITAVAWSWVGEEKVYSHVDPLGFFDREKRFYMLEALLNAIENADTLMGHNILRFDLRVLQAEAMRLGLPKLGPKKVIDTIRVGKAKGFKKSQDDMCVLLGVPVPKLKLNWQEWDDAYEEGEPWATVRERVESDVIQNKLLREAQIREGWVNPDARTVWRP